MSKLIKSGMIVLAVAAIAGYGTYSFFSDKETSAGNTFTAGAIDLKVDSEAHYAGLVCKLVDSTNYHWVLENTNVPTTRPDLKDTPCTGSWAQTDLGPNNKFFDYADVKPGDAGENTISLKTTNDAWMCANMKVTSNADGAGGASVVESVGPITFEPNTYTIGDINGQDGWKKTNPNFDVKVASSLGTSGFGAQSLRISDAVTSGTFGDQTFAKPLVNSVGETAATAGAFSVGTKLNHFETQFDIASAVPNAEQSGLDLSMSPDRGDGSRMSYLRFEDHADGIHVIFVDTPDPSHTTGANAFPAYDIATLTRTPHTIKLTMDVFDGPDNDVVRVYIDGNLVKTGTSWEDFYRYDPEQAAEPTPRIVKTVIFREGGTPNSANQDKGFLIDNFSTSAGSNLSGGALADGVQFITWLDKNGDNIHQQDETILAGPNALGFGATTNVTLADSSNNVPAFKSTDTNHIGIAWCAGMMKVDNGTGAITCDGSTMGNEAQNDSMKADITLTAEQARNNPTFVCGKALAGSLAAQDFGVMNFSNVNGYSAGFGVTDATLAGAKSVVVKLFAGNELLQTNTAIISKFNTDITGIQFSSPFDVFGTFNYPADGYWTNVRESEYGQTQNATKVVATVVLANGKVVTATNTNLTGGPLVH